MMRLSRMLAGMAACALAATTGAAQTPTTAPASPPATSQDPRVGLAAGMRDAGVAASGLELLANLPKPAGFFDPKAPAGEPNPKSSEDDEKKDEPAKDAKGGKTAKKADKKSSVPCTDTSPWPPGHTTDVTRVGCAGLARS